MRVPDDGDQMYSLQISE